MTTERHGPTDLQPDQLSNLVRTLYKVFLTREPGSDEIALHLVQLQSAFPLAAVNGIVFGEEAVAARVRHEALDTNVFPPRESETRHAELSSDELSDLVRYLYNGFLTRKPDANEIALHVGKLQSSCPLSAVNDIALCDEAVATRVLSEALDRSQLPEDQSALRRHGALQVLTRALALGQQYQRAADDVTRDFVDFCRDTALTTTLEDLPVVPTRPVSIGESQDAVGNVVRTMYSLALRRMPTAEDVDSWSRIAIDGGRLSDIVFGIGESPEAKLIRQPGPADFAPGALVQMAFEIVLDRGASAHDVDIFRVRIESGALDISALVMLFFNEQAKKRLLPDPVMNNPDLAYLFGSRGMVSKAEWNRNAQDTVSRGLVHDVLGHGSVVKFDRSSDGVISIITSLYRGGDFIRSFLENITSQTIFQSSCELIIIDAASPDGEHVVIDEYRKLYPNIVYKRMDTCIGIYEAWNIGVAMAQGKYLTNANLDDCRRSDSLEIQAGILDSLDFVDVTYQEVYYSFQPRMMFDEIAACGLRTGLPIVSRYNLMEFNCPHNAPMWRKSLHDDVGLFDDSLKSAADFDFWIRCQISGKIFYKVNDPHVAYYVNPRGVSTRPDTRGIVEAHAVSRKHYRKMVAPMLTISQEDFLHEVDSIVKAPLRSGRRYDIIQSALREIGSADDLPSGGHTA